MNALELCVSACRISYFYHLKGTKFMRIIFLGLVATTMAWANSPTGRYKTVVDQLERFQQQNPQFASLISLGENDEGTQLIGLRISTTPKVHSTSKLSYLVVGTHHGNEGKSPDLALKFIEDMLARYNSTEILRGQLDEKQWVVVPVLNVTGFNRNQRWEYGHDPNRDYPGPCHSGQGGKLKSINALRTHLKTHRYVGAITIHGYIGTLTYPWGVSTTNTHTHDHNAYASATGKAAQHNGYRHGTSTDLIYPATGTFEDWVYWKYGSWSLLVELDSGSKRDIEDTSLAMQTFFDELDRSPSGTHGLTGSCTRTRLPDLYIE